MTSVWTTNLNCCFNDTEKALTSFFCLIYVKLLTKVIFPQGISVEVVHMCQLLKGSQKMQHCVPLAHSTTQMLAHVLLASTAPLVQQNPRNALQVPLVMRPNCPQWNNARTVLLGNTVESSTWLNPQDPAERGTTAHQEHHELTGLSVLLEPFALMELTNLNCAPMGHLGTSLKGCPSMIALTAPQGITAKVLD